ncbi:hypothetical protein OIU77_021989 [Salix suchowensis]|uniref:Ubiquitin-like domain-containing protein n=1 Tax=Salix suchowensis TaxID=1278906 RepID=A0ABQ9CEZ4_9ROSI|nr:hypothetical protein OIU78_000158 [Salix suchowensis]KAJ6397059.1 hypothetical protein OIU77_021989 [Salix suchowensis]
MTIRIRVDVDGTPGSPIELPNDATVKDLKEAVNDMFESCPVENQEMAFNGRVLQDTTKLATCRVINNSEISIRILFTVVIVGKNRRYEVRAHENSYVGDLKQKLSEDYGLDITNMRLQMGPESYLRDDTLLWANRISSGTRVHIAEEYFAASDVPDKPDGLNRSDE